MSQAFKMLQFGANLSVSDINNVLKIGAPNVATMNSLTDTLGDYVKYISQFSEGNEVVFLTKSGSTLGLDQDLLLTRLDTYHTTSAFNTAMRSYYNKASIYSEFSALIGSAPAVLDTIQEIATALL